MAVLGLGVLRSLLPADCQLFVCVCGFVYATELRCANCAPAYWSINSKHMFCARSCETLKTAASESERARIVTGTARPFYKISEDNGRHASSGLLSSQSTHPRKLGGRTALPDGVSYYLDSGLFWCRLPPQSCACAVICSLSGPAPGWGWSRKAIASSLCPRTRLRRASTNIHKTSVFQSVNIVDDLPPKNESEMSLLEGCSVR